MDPHDKFLKGLHKHASNDTGVYTLRYVDFPDISVVISAKNLLTLHHCGPKLGQFYANLSPFCCGGVQEVIDRFREVNSQHRMTKGDLVTVINPSAVKNLKDTYDADVLTDFYSISYDLAVKSLNSIMDELGYYEHPKNPHK